MTMNESTTFTQNPPGHNLQATSNPRSAADNEEPRRQNLLENPCPPDLPPGGVPVVYQIRNRKDGKVYVGLSRHLRQRWTWHRTQLRLGKHRNSGLQAAWGELGGENFVFEVLEIVGPRDLPALREKCHIERLKATDPRFGYNIRMATAKHLNDYVCTDETRQKLSALTVGRPKTTEHRARLSEGTRRYAAENKKPPAPCTNCRKVSIRPLSRGLCSACYMYQREHEGEPRPAHLCKRPNRRRKNDAMCSNCPAVCVQLTRGRCPGCYLYFWKYEEERPEEMCNPLSDLRYG